MLATFSASCPACTGLAFRTGRRTGVYQAKSGSGAERQKGDSWFGLGDVNLQNVERQVLKGASRALNNALAAYIYLR
jgi:hypothetical protein